MENVINDNIEWKQLYDFENYMISNKGDVKSKERKGIDSSGREYRFGSRILKQKTSKDGKLFFVEPTRLKKNGGGKKTIYIHKAVAEHFLDQPTEEEIYILHINGIYSDNTAENLRWATKDELSKIHRKKRLESAKKIWETRRERYGENGLKS